MLIVMLARCMLMNEGDNKTNIARIMFPLEKNQKICFCF